MRERRFTGFRTPLTLSRMDSLRLPDDPRFRPHILKGACSMCNDFPIMWDVASSQPHWLTPVHAISLTNRDHQS